MTINKSFLNIYVKIAVSYLGFNKYFCICDILLRFSDNSRHHYVLLVGSVNYRGLSYKKNNFLFYFKMDIYLQTNNNTIYQNFQRSDIKIEFQQSYATFNTFLY